jgi:ZIP family zinc transporter
MPLTDLLARAQDAPFLTGLGASVLTGVVATTAGAAPLALVDRPGERVTNLLLSFAAGVMLAAAMFSLLLPAYDAARQAGLGARAAAAGVVLALAGGGALMGLAERYAPHEHFAKGREGRGTERLRRIWLFVIAVAIHNFPEGLAVGVGAASGNVATGLGVTLGIGLQNLPEGLAVAAGLLVVGYRRSTAFLGALASGLVEPLGGAVGAGAVALSASALPWALAFAAGAMLFVVSGEVIPETHRPGLAGGATAALFAGFAVMLFLTLALG